jgi:hypothetical protein
MQPRPGRTDARRTPQHGAQRGTPRGQPKWGSYPRPDVRPALPPGQASPSLPVLLWHGGGMTGFTWETTPDGRPGWLWRFLQAGYEVMVSDAVERGRSSWAMFPQVYKEAAVFRGQAVRGLSAQRPRRDDGSSVLGEVAAGAWGVDACRVGAARGTQERRAVDDHDRSGVLEFPDAGPLVGILEDAPVVEASHEDARAVATADLERRGSTLIGIIAPAPGCSREGTSTLTLQVPGVELWVGPDGCGIHERDRDFE